MPSAGGLRSVLGFLMVLVEQWLSFNPSFNLLDVGRVVVPRHPEMIVCPCAFIRS